jgi:hypothetical protein
MPRRLLGVAAVGLVLVAAFAAQAFATSRGHSLGGLGLMAFAALAGGAWMWVTRRR